MRELAIHEAAFALSRGIGAEIVEGAAGLDALDLESAEAPP